MPVIYIIISNLYINNLELSGHLVGLKIILDDVALVAMIVGFVLILYNLNLKKLLHLYISDKYNDFINDPITSGLSITCKSDVSNLYILSCDYSSKF